MIYAVIILSVSLIVAITLAVSSALYIEELEREIESWQRLYFKSKKQ